MGLSSIDLSSYVKQTDSIGKNYTPDYLKNDNNSDSFSLVETKDFSLDSNNLNNMGNNFTSSSSILSLDNGNDGYNYKSDVVDDFSRKNMVKKR